MSAPLQRQLPAEAPPGDCQGLSPVLFKTLRAGLIALTAGIALVALYCRVRLAGTYKSEVGGVERNVVFGVQQLLLGKPLYTDPSSPPYAILQYTPVYYYVHWAIAATLRVDATRDVHALLVTGRTLALIFNLCSVSLIWRCLRRVFFTPPIEACLACVYLFVTWGGCGAATRPDALKDVFFCGYLYCALLYFRERRQAHLWLAVLLSILGAFTKQNAIVYGPLLVGALALDRDWHGFRQVITIGAVGAVAVAGMALAAFGWALPLNVVKGVDNGISGLYFYEWIIKQYMCGFDALIAMALAVSLFLLACRRNPAERFAALATVVLYTTSTLMGLKWGGGGSYFAEFEIAAVVAIVACVNACIRLGEATAPVAAVMVAAGFVTCSAFLKNEQLLRGELKRRGTEAESRRGYARAREVADHVLAEGLREGHYVLSNDTYVDLFLQPYVLLPQMEIVAMPTERESMSNTYGTFPRHVFDYSSFGVLVAAGRLDWIVFTADVPLPTRYITADFGGYSPAGTLAGYTLYRPNSRPER